MTNIAAIAKGLTKAQREALLLWDTADAQAAGDDRLQAMLDELGNEGTRPLREMGLASRTGTGRAARSGLTPLGIAVRQHLQEQSQ